MQRHKRNWELFLPPVQLKAIHHVAKQLKNRACCIQEYANLEQQNAPPAVKRAYLAANPEFSAAQLRKDFLNYDTIEDAANFFATLTEEKAREIQKRYICREIQYSAEDVYGTKNNMVWKLLHPLLVNEVMESRRASNKKMSVRSSAELSSQVSTKSKPPSSKKHTSQQECPSQKKQDQWPSHMKFEDEDNVSLYDRIPASRMKPTWL